MSALERLRIELLKRIKQKTAIELGMDKKIIKDSREKLFRRT